MVTITESAASKIRELMAEDAEEDVSVLRIAIEGGGCSGFQYALGFDRGPQDGDNEVEMNGVKVVIDPFSAPYLTGSEIDYVDALMGAGLRDQQPERPGGVRMRLVLPGQGRRGRRVRRGRSGSSRWRLRLGLQPLALHVSPPWGAR